MRSLVRGGILAALVLSMTTPGSAVAAGGGCTLNGSAAFSPGLTNTAGPFTYSFGGDLANCQSNPTGGPATGTVEAGRVYTDPVSGQQFQEPASTGQGTCANGTTAGTAILRWADGTVTVLDYTTTSVAAAVHLSGTVVPSVTLAAINPAVGQPTSTTLTTTRYAGSKAEGLLAFQADPAQCAGAGLTSAGITGGTLLSDML
jgi:hypothetical protein